MKTRLIVSLTLLGLILLGCGSSESELSKNDLDALKNPSKTIPPEAAAAMAKQGELQQKQMDANKAAGVDARGVPIEAGDASAPPPPPPSAPGG